MNAIYYAKSESIDYTPETDVKAGDVVIAGDLVGIAKLDIPAGKLGALSTAGLFKVVKGAGAITFGAPVYWTGTEATATEGSNKRLGVAVAAAGADDERVTVMIG